MATDSERVVITAGTVNAPPVLAPIGAQSVLVGDNADAHASPRPTPKADRSRSRRWACRPGHLPGLRRRQRRPRLHAERWRSRQRHGAPPPTPARRPRPRWRPSRSPRSIRPRTRAPRSSTHSGTRGKASSRSRATARAPDTLVAIVDPTTGAALAGADAGANGAFGRHGAHLPRPVRGAGENADGLLGDAIPVMSAPLDCGKVLQTHAKPRWRCEDGMLTVRGSRAPMSSSVSVIDAAPAPC